MYKKISDYGIIGNLHSVALVGLDGSIDWLCMPHMDSPSVFAAILDENKGGRFSVNPAGDWSSSAGYIHDTNVLVTTFTAASGSLRLTDFMPVTHLGSNTCEHCRHELYRVLEVTNGDVDVEVDFRPRFDYARASTQVLVTDSGASATGGGHNLSLSSTLPLQICGGSAAARWSIREGERVWMRVRYGEEIPGAPEPDMWSARLDDTVRFWREWLDKGENGRFLEPGIRRDMVNRSALTLKLLFFAPSGTIAAAATTSLPEHIGGSRNWDYRFTWIRDAAFTVEALFNHGHLSEMQGYMRWIEDVLKTGGADELRIMYGLRGETELTEQDLPHLEGYMCSRPVRIGNRAAKQVQFDIFGELMYSALKLSDYVGRISEDTWSHLRAICDYVCGHWRDGDNGIWEVRGEKRQFVYSKVMCWAALNSGITIAQRYGFSADTAGWSRVRAEIKSEVLEKGWNREKGAFVQHYDTDALDASSLLIPVVGFLDYGDPRVVSNMEATVRELGGDGFLYRYKEDDGLSGEEGAFLLCTCWLIINLVGMGRTAEAEAMLERVTSASNHLGLFSEEYDVKHGTALGNFPQAFTHIGYLNSVASLCKEKARGVVALQPASADKPGHSVVLNEGEPEMEIPSGEIAARLKDSMNVLRGAFFDSEHGRVAYEMMRTSRAYENHIRLSRALKKTDPAMLATFEEGLAFWVNLYNVIVIHGVIELGVRDSIKEIRNFLGRVSYDINGLEFRPDDIEHGILRANRRPPYRLSRRFGQSDPRLAYSLERLDPRVHFALVCASSSCPPIAVYTPANIDADLDTAGRTFINSGGAVVDRVNMRISLSNIFRWYKNDFGGSPAERLSFIARYFFESSDREFVVQNAGRLDVTYQDYDWRLNRY